MINNKNNTNNMIKINNANIIKKRKNINLSFYVLLLLFVQVIFSDTIIYFSKIKYIYAQIISFIPNLIINYILIKKRVIEIKSNFEKWDIPFFVLFLLICILTIIFPDEYYDSYSYHIYLQKNVFADKINYDFFPGRTLTTYTYALVDRLYTLFTNKLGFRLGTIPSYFVIIIIYYEIKKIFDKLLNKNVNRSIVCLLSILPICAYIILEQIGNYYIDNICIALLLEFTYIILFENIDLFKNKSNVYYLSLLVGILVSAKFTNAFYIIIPLVYVLLKNIKDIKYLKWYDYFILILVYIIPMFVYMSDAIIDTGSPVFPYYNSIFKSKYFDNYNWYDKSYGTHSIFEVLIWPIILFFTPKRGYVIHKIDYGFIIGYILSILYINYILFYKVLYNYYLKKIKIIIDKNNMIMSLIILYYNFVLAQFCIGYVRYGGIIPILSIIFAIKLLIDSFSRKKFIYTIVLSYLTCSSVILGISNYFDTGKMTYYKGLFTNKETIINRVKINASCLLKDQDYLKYDINGIWGVIGDDSAVPSMLNVDDKIVQLRNGTMIGETEISNTIYLNNIVNNDIYIPFYELKESSKLNQLDEYGFEIVEIVDYLPNVLYMLDARPVYIVKVKYNKNRVESNTIIYNRLMQKFQETFN